MEFAMDETTMILIGIVVVVAAVAIGWWIARRRESRKLKTEFGPEYDHEVEVAGSRTDAEDELKARRERVRSYDLKELSSEERQRFSARWQEVQKRFVDQPGDAVEEASHLVDEAMKARGYPLGEIQQREADLSVNYPQEVQDYREAYEIAERNRRGDATTEDLREAIVHYRNLFEHLVGVDESAHSETA